MRHPSARDLGQILALVPVLCLAGAHAAPAIEVCTAAQVSNVDSGCPAGTGLCSITANLEVGENCVLDFGMRTVLVTSSGQIAALQGSVDLRAGSLSLTSGAAIVATGMPPSDIGGTVRIAVNGDLNVLGPVGIIDVSGRNGGGTILVEAGGTVRIGGRLLAQGTVAFGSGGEIVIRAGGNVETMGDAMLSVQGTRDGVGGGIDVFARNDIVLRTTIDVSGGEGGFLDLFSDGAIEMAEVIARGTGEAGSGGCLTAVAGTTLSTTSLLDFNGTGSGPSGGGCGGFLCLEAGFGDVNIGDDIRSEGALPDGGGGSIAFIATGSLSLPMNKVVSARGNGGQGCGGEICVDVGGNAMARSLLDASGGFAGGDVDITARRNIVISGGLTARGRAIGAFAGTTLLEAGFDATGDLLVTSPIDIGAGGCSLVDGCGFGGLAQLIGCNVEVGTAANIDGRGPEGAQIELSAREQLSVRGLIDARTTGESTPNDPPEDGRNTLEYPSRKPPVIGLVLPAPTLSPRDTCTSQPNTCLSPCPACGNGMVEFPETCDDGPGVPASCDGCSHTCRSENCDDGLICTIDLCAPQLGCGHTRRDPPRTPCFEPAQFSHTPTPTSTPTPSLSPTITLTPIPSPSPTASNTRPTATPTASATSQPSPTATTVACVGDCDGLGTVSVNELVFGVNIAIGTAAVADCLNLDRDRGGTVTIDELVAAVGNALNGCL